MTQELQELLEKIQKDGVDKARGETDRLLAEAEAKAREIVAKAREEAATLSANASQEAEAFENRARETIRQAARDAVLHVEKAVTRMLERLLLRDVNAALAGDQTAIGEMATAAVRTYLTDGEHLEVATGARLADILRAKLAAEAVEGVEIVTDETSGAGFTVRLAGGRIEHAFTGQAVAEALSRQLRPRLAAIIADNPA